jgi:uncharacterized protein YjbI with pentapeptide repeats
MNDEPDQPQDPRSEEADEPQEPGSKGSQYWEVSEEDLKRKLADHKKWLETHGEEGNRAHFREANLQGAILTGANLQEADLVEANLQGVFLVETNLQDAFLNGANLQGAVPGNANFQGARLNEANLQEAGISGANFQGARLNEANLKGVYCSTDTNFRGAVLSNADLTDAKSLLVGKLAGADLTNAKLPEAIKEFEGLKHVGETSQNARKIFFGLILGCIYSWLTVATTTDARLLTNSASSPLPIIQTEIPIAWFYWAAPVILLSVYFYLHLYLQRLWRGLAALPAVFPDGKPLDERAYPWLLNGLVRANFSLLKVNRPALSRLENFVSITLAWWLVPFTLVVFWIRYLPRHEWIGTFLQVACLLVASTFGMVSYGLARRTLRGSGGEYGLEFPTRWPWLQSIYRALGNLIFGPPRPRFLTAVTVLIAVCLSSLSLGAINGVRPFEFNLASPWTWAPRAFAVFGYSTFADLREADVSTKPPNWTGIAVRPKKALEGAGLLEKARAELGQVKGALLRDANLRYAGAVSSFLARANLQGANLQGANLLGANLQGAELNGANLQWASLFGANLQGAIFSEAILQRAILFKANVQGAIFRETNLIKAHLLGADLREAEFVGANLREADFIGANLQGADLNGANLQGADFTGANLSTTKNLTQEQLDEACGDDKTLLPDDLEIEPCPEEPEPSDDG